MPNDSQSVAEKREAHTPGPWFVSGPVGFVFTEGEPYGHGQMHVAQVRGWGHLTGKGGGCGFGEDKAIAIQDANAHLIAAAPTMLSALKKLRAYSDSAEAGEHCVSAKCNGCGCEIGWPSDSFDAPECQDCIINAAIAKATVRS
jgi:hypothetical protein